MLIRFVLSHQCKKVSACQSSTHAAEAETYQESRCTVVQGECCVGPLGQGPQGKGAQLSRPVPLVAVEHFGGLEHEG